MQNGQLGDGRATVFTREGEVPDDGIITYGVCLQECSISSDGPTPLEEDT